MCSDRLEEKYTNRHWKITDDISKDAPVWKTASEDCDTLLMHRPSPTASGNSGGGGGGVAKKKNKKKKDKTKNA
jgi:hypothetical protein